ncbi:MAG: hypothetical protein PCFJNLEI_00609 [Verrucomicrobiae bacterium]|nr:hypothetical protein [Verrucomicrobiae bacterium]
MLWQLDGEETGPAADPVGELEKKLKSSLDDIRFDEELTDPTRRPYIGYGLQGDAKLDRAGRFGGGVRLAGKGWIQSQRVDAQGGVTLDFWVNPDPQAPAAPLVLIGDQPVVERTATGQVQLGSLVHPRRVPANEWTHLAVRLGPAGMPTLFVNGTPAANTQPRLIPTAVPVFSLGKGLVGRIDAVRLTAGMYPFYELEETAQFTTHPLEKSPPYFVFRRPLVVEAPFDDGTAAGVRGRALDLGTVGKDGLVIGNQFPLQRGSVEFWVMPQDWENLFTAKLSPSEVPWLPILRYGPALRTLSLAQGKFSLDTGAKLATVPFRPGKWTHVLCSWNAGAVAVYLDGRPQPLAQVSFAGNAPAKEGVEYALTLLPSNTLIDELRVYPWALTGLEAANAYHRFFTNPAEPLTAMPFVQANPSYDYYRKYLHVGASCLPIDNIEPTKVTIRIFHRGGEKLIWTGLDIPLNASLQGGSGVPCDLEFGEYPIEVDALAADGRVLKTLKTAYRREKPVWWQNELGKNRPVPKPWTPVQVAGPAATVWSGTVQLAPGGLPVWETLAGPPQLRAKIAGQDEVLTGTAGTFGADATWTNTLTGGGVSATVTGSVEYDGLIKCAVTLNEPTKLEALTLDFPLKPEMAAQLIVNGGGHKFRASWNVQMVGEKPGLHWNSRTGRPGHKGVAFGNFCPIVWLGNDERGVCFFGENDQGWTPNGNVAAQEVIRTNDTVVYRMNIISQPVTNNAPRTFTFYVQPTPTKPLPEGWRGYNRGGFNGSNAVYEAIDAFVSPTLTIPSNTSYHAGITFKLEPTDCESAAFNAKAIRAKFGKSNPVIFYIDASWPQLGPSMGEYREGLFWTGRLTWSREVEDYMVWVINEYLRRGIIDGIYIDDTSLGSTRALYSTAYVMPNGATQPGFSTMGFRRFLQRVWVLFEQYGKQPHIVPHMTYCFEIPALSFASAVVNGEDRDIYPFATHSFIDSWSAAEVRIMGSSPKWGFINFWKPGVYTKPTWPPDPKIPPWMHWQSRAMHALMIPHDYWYLWVYPTSRTIEGPLVKFGIADPAVRFIPYWKLDGVAAATGNSILLSVYTKKDRALLIVSNLSKQEEDVTVTVDPQKLFGRVPKTEVQWKDVDSSLIGPEGTVATKADLNKINLEDHGINDLTGPSLRKLEDSAVGDFLQGDSPREKQQKHLALRVENGAVKLVVRKQDFRLLEVSLPRE